HEGFGGSNLSEFLCFDESVDDVPMMRRREYKTHENFAETMKEFHC
ncbi:hypothetical protein A2U01_0071067, partial [Trifolium medium]|nr:hypothetical protein [Trifolium medium]